MKSDIAESTRRLIGQTRVRRFEVTRKDIKRFAQAIDEPNLSRYNDRGGDGDNNGDMIAPPLFCQAFAFDDVPIDALPPDGSPMEINVDVPAKKAVGGGSDFEVFGPVRAGDRITVESTIKDIATKQGKSGLLYFIVVETAFFNQQDTMVARETATFIKR